MSQTNWEADKMLDVYIHDYLVKRDLKATAQAFQAEGKVSSDPVAINAPGGFLFEWWSVFWDIFIARTNERHSDVAASYIETQLLKSREQQQMQQMQQPQQPLSQQQQQQNLQMQHLLMQRQQQQQQQQQQHQQQQQQQLQQQHQQQQQQLQQQPSQQQPSQQQPAKQQPQPPNQQQRRDGAQVLNGSSNGLPGNDSLMRQNSSPANALATKMYEERLKSPSQRDALDDAAMKQRFSENAGQASGQAFHGSAAAMASQIQSQNQQLGGLQAPEIKTELNSVLNPRAAGPEASLSGIPGSNQASNNLTLKGWPLTGLDQLRSGFLQQQKSLMQASQPFHQLQMMSPQHQQQLMLAQQNLASASTGDTENRRLRMLLSNRNMGLGKDGFANSIGDIMASGSPLQTGSPVLPRGDPDMLMKMRLAQMQQQQQQQQNSLQQLQQNALSGQLPQLSNHNLHQPDKIAGASSLTMDGSMSNSFRGNDQAMKNQNGRKRKQPASSSGPANSSGTANTAGPSPNSPPSSPSTHTPGDVISMPSSLPHNGSSKPLMMFGADASSLTSPSNQLADIERFVEDGSLDDNVESFFSHDDIDPRDPVGRPMDLTKGFTFKEVNSVRASSSKVSCCHFSSDGKLLATGGHDKKVVLWYTDTLKLKSTLEEHTSLITDVRFSPSVSRLASSSHDKFVRVWDMDNPGYSLRNFTGHNAFVMSLDFHPNKDDLIGSCDEDGDIRYWSINNGSCTRVFKGGMTQMRFQPRHGRYLAAVAKNLISVFDVETQACLHRLQGHTKDIHSVCWDPSGEFVASVSEDSVRVWALGSGNKGECVHELSCNGNKDYSCVFHPTYPSFLVIGCYQSLDLWNMSEKKTMTLSAHEGLITALAASTTTGLVASTGHDKIVKLWK